MGLRIGWLTIDCRDPKLLAAWWREALGLDVVYESEEHGEYALAGKGWAGSAWSVLFYRAEGEKKHKNRLHLDLIPDDQAAAVARLKALGATEVDIGQADAAWVVLADPEGNEFCVLTPRDEPGAEPSEKG